MGGSVPTQRFVRYCESQRTAMRRRDDKDATTRNSRARGKPLRAVRRAKTRKNSKVALNVGQQYCLPQ